MESAGAGKQLETHSVPSSAIRGAALRLDAAFYRHDFAEAARRVTSVTSTKKVGELAYAFVPSRTRLITVPNPNAGAPYLRAHDAFEIRPSSDRYISRVRVKNYDELLLREGMILTPSSGRNLGPIAYVGSHLARFAMTDIMRIVPKSKEEGFYLLCYLLTPTAQSLIRRGRSGTTVDHLSPSDVLEIAVPWIAESGTRDSFVTDMQRAEAMLDEGRHGLDRAAEELHRQAGLAAVPPDGTYLARNCGDAFALSSGKAGLRLDAASHDPTIMAAAELIEQRGGTQLGQVARLKTLARYVRYYVEAPHGRPVLSGRQMLQVRPVNLRRISDRSFKDPTEFVLKVGTTIFTCDGRSEEALGEPAYVMPSWNGWLASEHVMRVEPLPEVGHGYLYLALKSPWVQKQLKARATGSVIDALEPEEIDHVMIPLLPEPQRKTLDADAVRCWSLISDAIDIINRAVDRFETNLRQRP